MLDAANGIGRVFTPSPGQPCTYFRFFTPLRCVQNDRERGRCAQNDRERGR